LSRPHQALLLDPSVQEPECFVRRVAGLVGF
jgi:hypothetical protein